MLLNKAFCHIGNTCTDRPDPPPGGVQLLLSPPHPPGHEVMGETKVATRARERGRQASDNELGVVISHIRKYMSTAFVRAQSLCLINIGEGAKAAAGRRDLAKEA